MSTPLAPRELLPHMITRLILAIGLAVGLACPTPRADTTTSRDLEPPGGTARSKGDAAAKVASDTPPMSVERLEQHVKTLAAQEMEGRLTGTEGERKATEYVASVFRDIGLEPAGSDGSFVQPFLFVAGVSLGEDNALIAARAGGPGAESEGAKAAAVAATSKEGVRSADARGDGIYALNEDWRPLSFSGTGELEAAGVVFAGYGIVAPEEGGRGGYDAYVHLSVKGKWVLALRFLPEEVDAETRQHLAPYATLRQKAAAARARGAHGIFVVSGPRAEARDELVALTFNASQGGSSLPAISVSNEVAADWLAGAGKDLDALQGNLDTGKIVMGFPLEGLQVSARIDLVKQKRTGHNVLARLDGGEGATEAALVVGAHVDHIGRGETGESLGEDEDAQKVHPGADDNASGVAAVLEIARAMSEAQKRGELEMKHDIIFAAWSGEELGLLGSSYYLAHCCGEAEQGSLQSSVVAYLNLDMVGRLRGPLIVQGVGSSDRWPKLIDAAATATSLELRPRADTYIPSDGTSFYLKGVPFIAAFTGAHNEYNTPRDTWDTLDYEGLSAVSRFMADVARRVVAEASPPPYKAVEKPKGQGRAGTRRVYLGTVPDFGASGVSGVKLSGVAAGGPAEKAGVRAGDVIVELAGTQVENLHDYTYALQALKVGAEASIVLARDGQRISLTIVPAPRQ